MKFREMLNGKMGINESDIAAIENKLNKISQKIKDNQTAKETFVFNDRKGRKVLITGYVNSKGHVEFAGSGKKWSQDTIKDLARYISNGSNFINENEIKFQALAVMKEIHSALAELTFVDVIAVMREENPLRKDVTALEKELNDLTTKVGDFVTNNLDDAVELEQADIEDQEKEKEEEKEQDIKRAEAAGRGAAQAAKGEDKTKENEKEIKESRKLTLADLDVEEGDEIYVYASKATPRMPVTVVGFSDNGKVNVKNKAGKILSLAWSHEASWDINEGSPIQDLTKIIAKTLYTHEYEMAIQMMQKEGIIAADAARRFKHVDARLLDKMFKEL